MALISSPPLQHQRVSRLNVIQFGHLNNILLNLLFSLPSYLLYLDDVLLSDVAPTQCSPHLDMPQGRWAQCPVKFIAAGSLAEPIPPCIWHLPVAGPGKGQGPRSSDGSDGSEHCNILKSISQLWWVLQIWNDLSSLFPWIYYRSSLFCFLEHFQPDHICFVLQSA